MSAQDLTALDTLNRQRALELASFIVEAPAGAGKTELLTQRFLRLLTVVDEPEEIIAITFTKKAVAEMRGRILSSLEDARDNKPVETDKPHKHITRDWASRALARDAALGWQILAQPARLRVMTIDSLSGSLARQMPLLSRLGGQPGMTENAEEHYQEAAKRTLGLIHEGNETIQYALDFFDNDIPKLTGLLANMLEKRDQWMGRAGHHAHTGLDEITFDIQQAIALLVQAQLQITAERFPARVQHSLIPIARHAARHVAPDSPIALLKNWQTPLDTQAESLDDWMALAELLLTQDKHGKFRSRLTQAEGFPANDAESKQFKAAFAEIVNDLADADVLAKVRLLPRLMEAEANAPVVKMLAQLLHLAAAQLWTIFHEAGEVDFVEMAQRAQAALENEDGATELAMRMDYDIKHLLIDEFQDTSPTQIDLLARLTAGWQDGDDGRTLFCVGDPMQSIYRFRKADVSLFLEVAEHGIGQVRLEPLRLSRNNRSCPAVVDWVNDTFETAFPARDAPQHGAIRYRPFVATQTPQSAQGVHVHALPFANGTSAEEAQRAEARHIARLIARELETYPARNIAILVRSRSHLKALVSELRRNWTDIPFQAVQIESLRERQTVQDAHSLIRAMLHLADRVHWLSILRAPWCGLMLEDLHKLAAHHPKRSIWDLMQDERVLQDLSKDGQQRLAHVRHVLAEAFAEQGRIPLKRWFEITWLKLGAAACLLKPGDVRDVQALFDQAEKLANNGSLDPLALEQSLGQLYAEPDANGGQVQMLTIHKSKGLEFDTVILPALNGGSGSDKEPPLLLWEQVEHHLLAAPWRLKHHAENHALYDWLKLLESMRADNELARLLYVAVTRTKQTLHLVGSVIEDVNQGRKPRSGTFLEILWPKLARDFLDTPLMEAAIENSSQSLTAFTPKLLRRHQAGGPAGFALTDRRNNNANMMLAQTATAQGNLVADCGTLAHQYLALWAQSGQLPDDINPLKPAMQRWLTQQGHPQQQAQDGAEIIAKALTHTLQSQDGRWVLKKRSLAATEMAWVTAENDLQQGHVIDRTFIENGTRWIIDYKLGLDVTEQNAQAVALTHLPQLERYASLFSGENLPLKKAVLFLNIGLLITL